MTMIWIDGDACPKVIKEIIYRCAERRKIKTALVANSFQQIPRFYLFSFVLVDKGMDAADHYISENATAQDLVITQDIPLAGTLVQNNITTISPRGVLFTPTNIGERLAVRNLLTDLRSAGQRTSGPPEINDKDKKAFADALDASLTKILSRRENL